MSKSERHIELLCRVLRMERQAYENMLFEQGVRYLELYMADDAATRKVLIALPEFWNWWRKAFDDRNAQFISEQNLEVWGASIGKWERALLVTYFSETHCAELMAFRPSRHVMRSVIKAQRATKR